MKTKFIWMICGLWWLMTGIAIMALVSQIQTLESRLEQLLEWGISVEWKLEEVERRLSAWPVDKQSVTYFEIPLSEEVQRQTIAICRQYEVAVELVFAVMADESGYRLHTQDHLNADGSVDRGIMQINSCNWGWLAEQGIDVNTVEGNIEAGVVILSCFLDQYPAEQALVAYECGEGRMQARNIRSTAFSRWIMVEQANMQEQKFRSVNANQTYF